MKDHFASALNPMKKRMKDVMDQRRITNFTPPVRAGATGEMGAKRDVNISPKVIDKAIALLTDAVNASKAKGKHAIGIVQIRVDDVYFG